jgi:hypothetical protein
LSYITYKLNYFFSWTILTLINFIFIKVPFQIPLPLCSQPPCSPPKTNSFYPNPCKNQQDCSPFYPFNPYVLRPSYAPSWPSSPSYSYPVYDPSIRYSLPSSSTTISAIPAPLKDSSKIEPENEWFNRNRRNSFSSQQDVYRLT